MKRNKMKKRGFTLVELLVVIAIIAMLLAILMPALGKVRQLAQRLMCGTNLSGIGKAMMIYANDSEYDEYPVAGGSDAEWINSKDGSTTQIGASGAWKWDTPNERPVIGDNATVSASLYLLVKFADVSPDQFICAGGDEKKFEINTTDAGAQNYTLTAEDVTECWDFGELANDKGPWDYCSYSYQLPYGGYAASLTSSAGMALAGDKNPLYDDTASAENFDGGTDDVPDGFFDLAAGDLEQNSLMKLGNSATHQGEGQNILYGDSHVKFEKTPNIGVREDNVYTVWVADPPSDDLDIQIGDDPRGIDPETAGTIPMSSNADSFLVNDGPGM